MTDVERLTAELEQERAARAAAEKRLADVETRLRKAEQAAQAADTQAALFSTATAVAEPESAEALDELQAWLVAAGMRAEEVDHGFPGAPAPALIPDFSTAQEEPDAAAANVEMQQRTVTRLRRELAEARESERKATDRLRSLEQRVSELETSTAILDASVHETPEAPAGDELSQAAPESPVQTEGAAEGEAEDPRQRTLELDLDLDGADASLGYDEEEGEEGITSALSVPELERRVRPGQESDDGEGHSQQRTAGGDNKSKEQTAQSLFERLEQAENRGFGQDPRARQALSNFAEALQSGHVPLNIDEDDEEVPAIQLDDADASATSGTESTAASSDSLRSAMAAWGALTDNGEGDGGEADAGPEDLSLPDAPPEAFESAEEREAQETPADAAASAEYAEALSDVTLDEEGPAEEAPVLEADATGADAAPLEAQPEELPEQAGAEAPLFLEEVETAGQEETGPAPVETEDAGEPDIDDALPPADALAWQQAEADSAAEAPDEDGQMDEAQEIHEAVEAQQEHGEEVDMDEGEADAPLQPESAQPAQRRAPSSRGPGKDAMRDALQRFMGIDDEA